MSNKNENKLVPKLRFSEFVKEGEWEEKIFSQMFEFGNGKDYKHLSIGNIPVYGTGGKMLSVNDYLYDGESVCIGRKGTIDNPIFLTGKFWTVDTLFYTHSFVNCVPKFVYYIFQNIKWYDYNEAGGVPSLSKTTISKIKTLIPPSIKEQQKIANCLSSLDEVITAESQKLEVLKEHKKGLLQNLFPQEGETVPKLRFKEFENSGVWEEKQLGEIADVSKLAGYEFTKHIVYENSGKIIALRGLNIKDNQIDLTNVKYIDNSELPKLNRSKLYVDDLMFTYIGTIGEVALIDEDDKYYLAPNVSRIRADRNYVQATFLLQYFNVPSIKDIEISKFISSSSQPALTMENVRKFRILLPPLIEQQKIVDCLSSLDKIIRDQTQIVESLKLHKKGLLQGLFPDVNEAAP